MAESNGDNVLEEMKATIAEAKSSLEKIMKMRIETTEMKMSLFRKFDSQSIKILQAADTFIASNEQNNGLN